jgi:phosphoribosyl 1,2-cyclic phosphate phosphodiesterase
MTSKTPYQIQFLGTGTSTGVPITGCPCEVCHSNDAKDKRMRTSAVIKVDKKNILIDASPDLRTQALRYNINHIESVFLTHTHADHVHGLDDLRPFCFFHKKDIPLYTHKGSADELKYRFPYIFDQEKYFKGKKILGGGLPLLKLHEIKDELEIFQTKFEFKLMPHGHMQTWGIIHSKMAYFTDIARMDEEVLADLKSRKLEYLFLDATRRQPHSTHLHLELSLEYAREIGAAFTGLIHLSHDFFHDKLCDELAG